MFRHLRFPLVLCSFLVVCVFFVPSAHAQEDERVLRWIEEVVLRPEFGGSGKVCSRWVRSPSLSFFGATVEQEKLVAETVAHLNQTLAETPIQQIKLLKSNNTNADILVYFAPLKEFPVFAQKHNFRYVEGNYGYFWTFWNPGHEIERAYVLLASDKLQGKKLRHFALEEITQTLGLSNDSPIFPDSIFYAKGDDGGNAQQLSDLDKKLIRFFYNHVRPGAREAELRAAYWKYWPSRNGVKSLFLT